MLCQNSESVGTIRDKEGFLSLDETQHLARRLDEAARDQPAPLELIVCLVGSVPAKDFRERALRDRREFSTHPDRSILLLISLGDRHAEIATAPRFSRDFTAANCSKLLRTTLVPRMQDNLLPDAIESAVTAIAAAARAGARRRRRIAKWGFAGLAAMLLSVAGVFGYVHVSQHLCRQCSHWTQFQDTVRQAATVSSEGLLERHVCCPACGDSYTEYRRIPQLTAGDRSDNFSGDSSGGDGDSGDSGGDGGGGADW